MITSVFSVASVTSWVLKLGVWDEFNVLSECQYVSEPIIRT